MLMFDGSSAGNTTMIDLKLKRVSIEIFDCDSSITVKV